MTRSELIAILAERFPQLVRQDIDIAVAEILGAISRTLSQGGRVEIRGFGIFSLNYRPPRAGRNPKKSPAGLLPGSFLPAALSPPSAGLSPCLIVE